MLNPTTNKTINKTEVNSMTNTNVTTLDQAEMMLKSKQVIQISPHGDKFVEGTQVLDVAGLSYIEIVVTTDGHQKTKDKSKARLDRQIKKHKFVEGKDFVTQDIVKENGRKAKQCCFTLNAANHIVLGAMTVEGKAARQEAIEDKIKLQAVAKVMALPLKSVFQNKLVNLAMSRAGHKEGLVQWKPTFIKMIEQEGVVSAATDCLEHLGSSKCNRLMKQGRITFLKDVESFLTVEQDNYRMTTKRKDYSANQYNEYETAIRLIAQRRARVLQLALTAKT